MRFLKIFFKFSLFLPLIMASIFFFIIHPNPIMADNIQSYSSQDYFHTPSPDPIRGVGFWISGGFNIQPESDYYVTLGDSKTINTNSVRPLLSSIYNPSIRPIHREWYVKQDNGNWVQNSDITSRSFEFTPQKVGTTYFQVFNKYFGLFSNENYYSKIATVHTIPKPINANKLYISVNPNYVYNSNNPLVNNEAFASYKTDKYNATGKIQWKSSDDSLATIDENGYIKANTQGKSGNVSISASLTNPDNSIIYSQPEKIQIGGGLNNQTVKTNDKATFHIQTADSENRDSSSNVKVTWYKRNIKNNTITQLTTNTADPTTYITNPTTLDENGDKYYAVIKVNTKTFKTNEATLTVLPPTNPDANLNETVKDITYSDINSNDTALKNVATNDEVLFKTNVKNSGHKDFHNSNIKMELPLQTKINDIKINNKVISSTDYSYLNSGFDNSEDLTINTGDLNVNQEKEVDIDTTVGTIFENNSFGITNTFQAVDSDNKTFENDGNKLTLDLITNNLIMRFKNIQFESITQFQKGVLKQRENSTNSPNNAIDIDDQRREKFPVKIFLKQNNGLFTKSGQKLPASLIFKIKNNLQAVQNKLLIASSEKGENFSSIKWDKNQGLLLHIDNNEIPSGSYSTKLDWEIDQSI